MVQLVSVVLLVIKAKKVNAVLMVQLVNKVPLVRKGLPFIKVVGVVP